MALRRCLNLEVRVRRGPALRVQRLLEAPLLSVGVSPQVRRVARAALLLGLQLPMHLGQFPLPLRQQRLRLPITHRRISRLRRADAVAPHDARDQFRLGLLAVRLPLLDALRQLPLGVPRAPHRVVGPLIRVGGPSFQALGGGVVRRLDVLQGRVRAVRVRLEARQVPPMSLGDGQRLRVPLVAVPDLLVPPP